MKNDPDKKDWVRFGLSPRTATLVVPEGNPAFELAKKGTDFQIQMDFQNQWPLIRVNFGTGTGRKGWERFRDPRDASSQIEQCCQIATKFVAGAKGVQPFRVTTCEVLEFNQDWMLLKPEFLKPVAHAVGCGGARKMKGGNHPYQPPRGAPRTLYAPTGPDPVDVGEGVPCGETIELEPRGRHLSLSSVIRAMNRYKDKQGDRVQFQILKNGHIAADVVVRKRIGE